MRVVFAPNAAGCSGSPIRRRTSKLMKSWRSKLPFPLQYLLAALFALLLCYPLYYNFYQTLPKFATAKLEALHNREYSKAYFAYTTHDFKNKFDLFNFREFVQRHPIITSYQSYQVDSVDRQKGTISLQLKNESLEETLTFIRER